MTSLLLKTPPRNAPTCRTLPTGLTIVAEQMPVDAVNLNIWCNVGSAVEPDEINGMAHFLEHMVFRGTTRLNGGEFERQVEERGAVVNAATSQDYTHFYITAAPQDFADLAPLQFDVVLNPTLAELAFEQERPVILEEIRRAQDNPSHRLYLRAMETCFETLPYRRPVLGSTSVIEQLTAEQMRQFHRQWYRPQALSAAVVGNLPAERLIEIVAESCEQSTAAASLSPWQWDNVTLPPAAFPEAISTETTRQEFIDPQLQQARLLMAWPVPGLIDLPPTYALDVLAVILGQGKLSRLFRELREEQQLVAAIGASNTTHRWQGVFYIGVQLPAENIEAVEATIARQIRTFQTEPVTSAELGRIRTQVANRFIFSNERPSDRANLYGYYQSMLGTLEPAFDYPQRIQAVEPEDIQDAAQRYLSLESGRIVVAKPQSPIN